MRNVVDREKAEDIPKCNHLISSGNSMPKTTTPSPQKTPNVQIEVPRKSYEVYNIPSAQNDTKQAKPTFENNGSILVRMYNNTNRRFMNQVHPLDISSTNTSTTG